MKLRPSRPVRLVLVGIVVGLILGLAAPRLLAIDEPAQRGSAHVVGRGETLWRLAGRESDGDPRKFVYETMRINGLENPVIRPGQILILP